MRKTSRGQLGLRVYGKIIDDFKLGTLRSRDQSFDAPEFEDNDSNDQETKIPETSGNDYVIKKFESIRFGMSSSLEDAGQSFVPSSMELKLQQKTKLHLLELDSCISVETVHMRDMSSLI